MSLVAERSTLTRANEEYLASLESELEVLDEESNFEIIVPQIEAYYNSVRLKYGVLIVGALITLSVLLTAPTVINIAPGILTDLLAQTAMWSVYLSGVLGLFTSIYCWFRSEKLIDKMHYELVNALDDRGYSIVDENFYFPKESEFTEMLRENATGRKHYWFVSLHRDQLEFVKALG